MVIHVNYSLTTTIVAKTASFVCSFSENCSAISLSQPILCIRESVNLHGLQNAQCGMGGPADKNFSKLAITVGPTECMQVRG